MFRLLCQLYTGFNCEYPMMFDEKDRVFTDFHTGVIHCKEIRDCDCRYLFIELLKNVMRIFVQKMGNVL